MDVLNAGAEPNSHNKATMVDGLNAWEVEDGNWSDKDIVIAYVHFSEHSSTLHQSTYSVSA